MAEEANPGKEASPTVGRHCAVAGGSDLAYYMFLLSLKGPALLCCVGSFDDEMAPGGSV